MHRFALFLLLILSISSSADDFSYEMLKSLITQKNIQSIDELIEALPLNANFQSDFVYKSRSMQPASFAEPRVVVFTGEVRGAPQGSTGGRFSMAYAGSRGVAGSNILEVIQFNDQTSQFEFHQITFPDKPSRATHVVFNEGAETCLRCHASLPPGTIVNKDNLAQLRKRLHPIWDSYHLWPGVYKSHSERGIAEEILHWQDFIATKRDDVRYKRFLIPNLPSPGIKTRYEGFSLYNDLLNPLNAQRKVNEIQMHPKFQAYKNAFSKLSWNDESFLAALPKKKGGMNAYKKKLAEITEDSIKKLGSYAQERIERHIEQTHYIRKATSDQHMTLPNGKIARVPEIYDIESISRVRLLAQEMGVDFSDWSMVLNGQEHIATAGPFKNFPNTVHAALEKASKASSLSSDVCAGSLKNLLDRH